MTKMTPLLSSLSLLSFGIAAERPLSTDRPDTTESPRTVPAGRIQLEGELGSWTRENGGEGWTAAEWNLKWGVNDATDVQLVIPTWSHAADGAEGWGDLELRLKHNFWGNDVGDNAFALMPFLRFPTASEGLGSGQVEGGLIAPFGWGGPANWSFGIMGEVDVLARENGDYGVGFLGSATAGHDLTETTAFFIELVAEAATDDLGDFALSANAGLLWSPRPDWQFDAGLRVGLNETAPDLTFFVGFSIRR